jgi:hypothetical protein
MAMSFQWDLTRYILFPPQQLYPTPTLWNSYVSINPEVYAIVVSLLFFIIAFVYFAYDKLVDKRNEMLMTRFARSNAIVASLFPKSIKERLLEEMNMNENSSSKNAAAGPSDLTLSDSTRVEQPTNGTVDKPLADLFLDATILFSDLAGFTA